MTIQDLRTDLQTALEASGRVVYAYPREQIVAPSLTVVPGSPYIELMTFNGVKVRFNVTAAVDVADNNAALYNLETLMMDVLAALPDGYNGVSWSSPQISEVSGRQMLISELQVECAANVA